MIKKLMTTLVICALSTTLFAKEAPSLQETVDFINRVMSSDEASSKAHDDYNKPYFEVTGDCNIVVRYAMIPEGTVRYYIELKLHKFIYNKWLKEGNMIAFEDRINANTVKYDVQWPDGDLNHGKISSSGRLYVKVHKKYQKKMEKALNHLSTMCVGELGKDDPF